MCVYKIKIDIYDKYFSLKIQSHSVGLLFMLLLRGIVALNGSPRDYFNKNSKNVIRFSSYKCKVKPNFSFKL